MLIIKTPAGNLCTGSTMPALFVDLDGTVRGSKSGKEFISGADDVVLLPNTEEVLRVYRKTHLIFGVSNQGGVAFGYKTPEGYEAELFAMIALFAENPFHGTHACYHHPQGHVVPYNADSQLRKPNTGMLTLCELQAYEDEFVIDWSNSLMVGDRPEDEECARRGGIHFVSADAFFRRGGSLKSKHDIRESMPFEGGE